MENRHAGHSAPMALASALPAVASQSELAISFEDVYAATFDFAWRLLKRLGVPDGHVDDAAQDVFVAVHRRLRDFAGRSTLKTWVAGIAVRVASDARRAQRRRGESVPLPDTLPDPRKSPLEVASNAEALRLVQLLLSGLQDDQREVFVLTEMEQMTAPEISLALGINLNTVYSRLRLARRDFDAAVQELALKESP